MKTQPLSKLADIQTGPFGSQLHKEDYVEIGTPIVTVEHLGNRVFTEQNLPRVKDADKERLTKYVLCTGDIVFSRVGSVDRCSYVDERHNGWMFSGRCLRVRPTEEIDAKYLYYFFCLEETKQFIRNIAVGATMPSINTKLLGEVEITYPDITGQRKIASLLSAIDDKIELNNAINDNLEQQAQAIYIEWCSRCSEQVEIGDVVDNILDYTPNLHSEVVLVNSSEVTEGHFEHHNLSENANLKGHFKKRFQKYDVLFSEIRPKNKHYAYVLFDADKYIASTRLMVIRAKQGIITPSLLYQHLSSQKVCDEFASTTETRSGTFPQGCFADLSKITIPYMPIEQQKEITDFLDSVYSTIEQNDSENRRLAEMRDALLPRLMSGAIDVSDVQI